MVTKSAGRNFTDYQFNYNEEIKLCIQHDKRPSFQYERGKSMYENGLDIEGRIWVTIAYNNGYTDAEELLRKIEKETPDLCMLDIFK